MVTKSAPFPLLPTPNAHLPTPNAFTVESRWHTVEFEDVEINVVPEGGTARNDSPTLIPSPASMRVSSDIDYADLPHWGELKVSSWRRKDQTHVVEVLKSVSLETEI